MALVDISRKLSTDLNSRHEFLANAAKSCIGWTSRIEGVMLGRSLEEADESTRGAFVTQEGYLVVYGLRKRFLQIEWSIADAIPLHELTFHYQYSLDILEVTVECSNARLSVKLRLSLLESEIELMNPLILPGFTGKACVDGVVFGVPTKKIKLSSGEDSYSVPWVVALIGRTDDAVHLKYLNNESFNSLTLLDQDFLGDVLFNSELFYVWRVEAVGVVAVHFGQGETLASLVLSKFDSAPLRQVVVKQLPTNLRVKGVLQGEPIDEECVVILNTSNSLSLIDSKCQVHSFPSETKYFLLRNSLVFIASDSEACGVLAHSKKGASDLQTHLRVKSSPYPIEQNQFLVFLSCEGEKEKERAELLEVDQLILRTKVGLSKIIANAENIDRITSCEFWIRSQDEKVWRARLDSADDNRFRQTILQARTDGRVAQSNGLARLYEISIDLQANRFMELLFNELFILFQEMERKPNSQTLVDTLSEQSSLDAESEKALLSKIVLLAGALPELKRGLERTGTFYPHQMRGGDDAWLKSVFGEEFAKHWDSTHGRSEIAQIRSFVRNTQSNLWRSLAETERSLSRLEPVYSDNLKSARTKSFKQSVALSASIATVSVATGQWYIPILSVIQITNSCLSLIEVKQQHKAILLDHGLDLLRWWGVFVETFAVQVHESHAFIRDYLDKLAKRDCNLFKKVAPADQTRFANHLRAQLELRIQKESETRFQLLCEGATQLKQDLIEGLGRLAQQGNRLRICATKL